MLSYINSCIVSRLTIIQATLFSVLLLRVHLETVEIIISFVLLLGFYDIKILTLKRCIN